MWAGVSKFRSFPSTLQVSVPAFARCSGKVASTVVPENVEGIPSSGQVRSFGIGTCRGSHCHDGRVAHVTIVDGKLRVKSVRAVVKCFSQSSLVAVIIVA
jgi:hypothetical protein